MSNIRKFNFRMLLNSIDFELSAYIKFGCLSIREIHKSFHNNKDFIRQLHWRDFYAQIMYFNPHVLGNALNSKYDKIKWHNSARLFKAWCDGKT